MFAKLKSSSLSLIIITAASSFASISCICFACGPHESFPRSPLVRLPYGPLSQKEPCTGLSWRFRQMRGGAPIRGAGKNAEFFILGPTTNDVGSCPLAGRHSNILNEERRISSREGVTSYASQGLGSYSIKGPVNRLRELIQSKG